MSPSLASVGARGARFGWVLLVALVGRDLEAAQGATTPDEGVRARLKATRPRGEDGSTEVQLGFFIVDVPSINDANETFTADCFYTLKWRDPRLVSELGLGGSQVSWDDIWTPRIFVVNRKDVSSYLDDVVDIDDEGTVSYRQRLVGEFTCSLDLRRFPFDEQDLAISLVVIGSDAEDIRLVPDPALEGTLEDISPAGWEVEFEGPEVTKAFTVTQDRRVPRIDQRLRARRLPAYYRLKIFLPLSLIVFMAWTVFWIDPRETGPQIGVSTSSVITLIAFQLALGSSLPRVAFPTRADYFVLGATVLVFCALAEAIMTGRLARAGRPELAHRIDVVARAVYPTLFAVLVGLTALGLT